MVANMSLNQCYSRDNVIQQGRDLCRSNTTLQHVSGLRLAVALLLLIPGSAIVSRDSSAMQCKQYAGVDLQACRTLRCQL
jgi:hypothetical protein